MANLLLNNPGFESGTIQGWTAYLLGSPSASTNGPRTGNWCCAFGSADATYRGVETASTDRANVSTGTPYTVEIWARNGGLDTPVQATATWYDSGGTAKGTDVIFNSNVTGTGAYNRCTAQLFPPSGATKAGIRIAAAGGNTVFADDALIEVLTTPAAPTNLTVSLIAGVPQLQLNWTDNADNETSWTVERSVDGAAFVSYYTALTANVVSYVDSNTDLLPGHTYAYRVLCQNLAGNSAYSNQVSFTIPGLNTTGILSATGIGSISL